MMNDNNPVKGDFNDILDDARKTAKQKAKSALREKNKNEWTCELTTIGNPGMCSGMTFIIDDFGVFSGKYIATQVTHTLGESGYTTQIKGRRCLEGY